MNIQIPYNLWDLNYSIFRKLKEHIITNISSWIFFFFLGQLAKTEIPTLQTATTDKTQTDQETPMETQESNPATGQKTSPEKKQDSSSSSQNQTTPNTVMPEAGKSEEPAKEGDKPQTGSGETKVEDSSKQVKEPEGETKESEGNSTEQKGEDGKKPEEKSS